MRRKLVLVTAAVLLVGLVVAGLLSARDTTTRGGRAGAGPPGPTLEQARARLRGAPRPLAGLHAQSSKLLGEGVPPSRSG